MVEKTPATWIFLVVEQRCGVKSSKNGLSYVLYQLKIYCANVSKTMKLAGCTDHVVVVVEIPKHARALALIENEG